MIHHRPARWDWLIILVAVATGSFFAQELLFAAANYATYLPFVTKAGTVAGPSNPTHTGEATYYTEADGSGNCSFDPSPQDLIIGALNHTDYADSALCGAFLEVTGPRATITIRIVDQCPGCPVGDIDLSPQAFAAIADLSAGRVPITWRIVSPAISGPIRYRFKEGSSQWWTAVQVRNHRNPIAKFEYRDGTGQFVSAARQDYNYFVAFSGMGPGPYTFRITDIYGNVVTDSNITLLVGQEVPGSGQFPKGP
ncbi:MAG: expansin EXLX1 family cellulose-binding protein [Roseiflexaceae bacterium]|nr:expansin EXLX1 family cellulose-binding protein [Roseiflexaceae bacterium]